MEESKMTMRERIREGKLFTDECEGLPEERMSAKTTRYLRVSDAG